MRLKTHALLVLSLLLAAPSATTWARTQAAIADPAPACGLLCIDPIDPVDVPVNVYTIGTGKQTLGSASNEWKPIGVSIWRNGTHTPWSPAPEQGDALFVKGQDFYSLSFPAYEAPGGNSLPGYWSFGQGGPILRRNGVVVRQYPSLPGNPVHGLWDPALSGNGLPGGGLNGKLWVAGNNDVYALVRMSSMGTIVTIQDFKIYRNDTLFKDFSLDGFEPYDFNGGSLANGQAAIIAGGVRAGRATIWKNNAYLTLSKLSSKVTSLVRMGNGWIHATGIVYAPGDPYAAYWSISPTNVVTLQRLSEDFTVPPQTLAIYDVTPNDIHVAADGKVYIAGNFSTLWPYDPAVQTGVPNPYGRNAVVWVDGVPQVLPGGDMYMDWDDAQAVTTDVNGNYYVAGTWFEQWWGPARSSHVGVVWKNGELYQIADDSADASVFADVVVSPL